MKGTITGLVVLLLLIGGLRWFRTPIVPALDQAPRRSMSIASPSPDPSFIARQIEALAEEAAIPSDASSVQVMAAEPSTVSTDPALERVPSNAPPATGIDGMAAAPPAPKTPDDAFLRSKASEFAYVEFKGIIGGKGLASLCYDPITHECEVVGEGSVVREITVSQVHPDHLVLTHGSAAPLTKPRVDLDVEYKPMDQMTPEEHRSRSVRYQELFGNRFDQALAANHNEHGGGVFQFSTPEEQANARRVYRETYGEYFNSLQTGAVKGDNRELPPGAPTLDEIVQQYLDLHWPDGREPAAQEDSLSGREN